MDLVLGQAPAVAAAASAAEAKAARDAAEQHKIQTQAIAATPGPQGPVGPQGLQGPQGPTGANDAVKVSAADTTASNLNAKITGGVGIGTQITSPGGNEKLDFFFQPGEFTLNATMLGTDEVLIRDIAAAAARRITRNVMLAGTNGTGARTVSTALPSGGADGDVWYQV